MEYLLIDIGTILVPLLFSFHPRICFYRTWHAFWPANLSVGCVFIVWDVLFTKNGIWGFDPAHLVGVDIAGLPLEEHLFFICIPYACVFTYFSLSLVLKPKLPARDRIFTLVLAISLLLVGSVFYDRPYTATTFISLALWLLFVRYLLRSDWLIVFYISYAVLLVPFFVVNGLLTGTGFEDPIVWYDDTRNLGFRLHTIPVEDIFYGMLLILMNVTAFEGLLKRWRHPLAFLSRSG